MRKNKKLSALVLAALASPCWNFVAQAAPVAAVTQPIAQTRTSDAALGDNSAAIELVRATLMSIHDANVSGNYTVLKDLGSPTFQRRTASDLAYAFAPLRVRKLDLFTAASIMPVLTALPEIDKDKRLHVRGAFMTRPEVVVFDFVFELVDQDWKHSALNIGLEAHVKN